MASTLPVVGVRRVVSGDDFFHMKMPRPCRCRFLASARREPKCLSWTKLDLFLPQLASPLSVRISTLGILILMAALLAALPFRRSRTNGPDADDRLATGPTTPWTVDPSATPWGSENPPATSTPAVTPVARMPLPSSVDFATGSDHPTSIATDGRGRPRRDIRAPLTFEDLSVPESSPHYRDQRFGAVAVPVGASVAPQRIAESGPRFDIFMPPTGASMEGGPMGPGMTGSETAGTSSAWAVDFNQPASVLQSDGSSLGRVVAAAVPPTGMPSNEMPSHPSTSDRTLSVPTESVADRPAPPLGPAATVSGPPRERHWIRQPD